MAVAAASNVGVSRQVNPRSMSLEEKLKVVVQRAAAQLPAEIGKQLLALIEPTSLAIMAGVVVVWAGAQFFGVGEVADVVLIVAGWIAFGGVAISAGKELVHFALKTYNAQTDQDLTTAAAHLAKGVTLLGVQTVLALLLKKPSRVLKDQYFQIPGSTADPLPFSAFGNLPSNRSVTVAGRTIWWGYKPSMTGNPGMAAGTGATDIITGDIEYSLAGTLQDQQLARAHELVHQFLTPKLNLLRGLRGFARAQGYNRSYLLRYLEEALCETIAQLRVKGINTANFLEGVRFPVNYGYVSVVNIQAEGRGMLLGPINVGGQIFNVWYSEQ